METLVSCAPLSQVRVPMSRRSFSFSGGGAKLGLPCAVLNEESKKGQDRHAALEVIGVSAFGVYDGHGGTECAEALKEALLPRLLAEGFPADADIANAFWTIDEEAGAKMAQQDCHAGSTCTVLIVGTPEAKRDSRRLSRRSSAPVRRDLRCKLAWVRDAARATACVPCGACRPRSSRRTACSAAAAVRGAGWPCGLAALSCRKQTRVLRVRDPRAACEGPVCVRCGPACGWH